MVYIATRIPEELRDALRKQAVKNKRTLSGELHAILDDLLTEKVFTPPPVPYFPLPKMDR